MELCGAALDRRDDRRLGIKLSTVYMLCAKGALPHVRLGSLLRIDVESYLASPRSWNRKP